MFTYIYISLFCVCQDHLRVGITRINCYVKCSEHLNLGWTLFEISDRLGSRPESAKIKTRHRNESSVDFVHSSTV